MFVFNKGRREREMEKVNPKQRPQFVLFGSSLVQYSYYTTEGWGATLSHLYARKADITLRGYGGWNTRHALKVLDKVFPKDAPVQPSLVIVHFGSEDSTRNHPSGSPHVPLQEYIENLRQIAFHIMGLSKDTRVIFLSTPPVNEDKIPVDSETSNRGKPRTNELSRTYSFACLSLCIQMQIPVIDLFGAIKEEPNWQECFLGDGVTLSKEGNIVVYKRILAALKNQVTWTPSLYWTNMKSEFRGNSLGADGGETEFDIGDFAFPKPEKWDDSFGKVEVKTQFF